MGLGISNEIFYKLLSDQINNVQMLVGLLLLLFSLCSFPSFVGLQFSSKRNMKDMKDMNHLVSVAFRCLALGDFFSFLLVPSSSYMSLFIHSFVESPLLSIFKCSDRVSSSQLVLISIHVSVSISNE